MLVPVVAFSIYDPEGTRLRREALKVVDRELLGVGLVLLLWLALYGVGG